MKIPSNGFYKMHEHCPCSPTPRQITVEVVDNDRPVVIGDAILQKLNLLKLNWPITSTPESQPIVKVFDVNDKGHPTP